MTLERLFSAASPAVVGALDAALAGRELSVADAERLLQAQGTDLFALMQAADFARREDKGDDVSFVVNRNINFTNVCYVGCSFCGFSRHKDDADAYDHPMEVLLGKARDAVARGASEVCIQGGIHPGKDHTHYREILETIKAEFPELHIHAFSPEEIDFGHRKSGMPLAEIGTHLGAAAIVLTVAFVFFARGWIGGGDAKLAAATALWLGFDQLLNYVILASLFGGLLTLLMMRFRLIPLPRWLENQPWATRLHRMDAGVPYGIALAIAALVIYPDTTLMKSISF